MISDSFKAMSTQILEVEIYVKLIQLHLAHLQIKFRQRMKKKQHDVLIFNFCNKSKVVWRFSAIDANDEL
jgi:hypothetical protein